MLDVDSIKPYGPNVLVRRLAPKDRTITGIALPEKQKEANLQCRVVAVGSGEWVNGTHIKSNLQPGDTVIIRQFDGETVGIDRQLLLVHHDLIEARVNPTPA